MLFLYLQEWQLVKLDTMFSWITGSQQKMCFDTLVLLALAKFLKGSPVPENDRHIHIDLGELQPNYASGLSTFNFSQVQLIIRTGANWFRMDRELVLI